jgi:hypothetical protein
MKVTKSINTNPSIKTVQSANLVCGHWIGQTTDGHMVTSGSDPLVGNVYKVWDISPDQYIAHCRAQSEAATADLIELV